MISVALRKLERMNYNKINTETDNRKDETVFRIGQTPDWEKVPGIFFAFTVTTI